MNNPVLLKNLRWIPDFPKKGINFRDVTTLYKSAECMKIMLDEMEELYKDKGITKIVGVESRGFVMAAALAARLGCGVVLARKPGKLPATVIRESFSKEYGVCHHARRCSADTRRPVSNRRYSNGSIQVSAILPPQEDIRQLHRRDYR